MLDEAHMSHCHLLEYLDRSLKDIMNKDLHFGGKLLILGGDFRQIITVVRRVQRSTLVKPCLKQITFMTKLPDFATNMRVLNC